MENTQNTETKETIIGNFKPKRKFLNFVSAVNGAKIRFIRDIAFLKGEKLSGTLEGVVFKITICDEGTINFEEVDTNRCDNAQIQRLIDDIDSMNTSGYAQKYIVSGIEFADKDGGRCYLEVEEKKPIDKLKSIFQDEKPTLSDKGFSLLDSLFSEDTNEIDDDHIHDTIANSIVDELYDDDLNEIETKKDNEATSYMEESFKKMNEDKVKELKKRIEDTQKESLKLRSDISQAENKLKKVTEDLGVLETRLDSFNDKDEPNGYVFYISEEQKPEDVGLTDETKSVADKIADIMGLKKDVLFKMLTQGYYTIKIASKDNITEEKVKVNSEVMNKILLLVLSDKSGDAKVSQVSSTEYEFRGSLTWHQLVGKMLKNGFEQNPEFDKLCNSNSYQSKEENIDDKKQD